jgi:RNA polymerase sigma-70 factor, ECF subfamily
MSQNSSTLYTMHSVEEKAKFIITDEELIGRFQKGDENAYIELVRRYKDRLLHFVFQYLGDYELSEDVVQDTMIKLYIKKDYYKEIAKFSTWLYTIAKNLALTELRKRKRKKVTQFSHMSREEKQMEFPAIQPETGQAVQDEFANKMIHNAIQELPEHFKTVVILRDVQELSYDEISEIVGVPLGTVKSRINRARIQLQSELQELRS